MGESRQALGTRAFLSRVQTMATPLLAAAKLTPEWRQGHGLLQATFGPRQYHYEVWPQRSRNQVEVGLHFEGDARLNAWLLAGFAAEMLAVRHELGPGFELEQWTTSWGRVHTYVSAPVLDEDLAQEVARTLADCVLSLQPRLDRLLAEAGVA